MDETLIRCQKKSFPQHTMHIKVENSGSLFVACRPFLKEVLERLAESFELVLFTAGSQRYVNFIINALLF